MRSQARLVVSLDIEMYWGLRHRCHLDECRDQLLASRRLIPDLLELFSAYGVRATWPAVGFLFCRTKHDLLDSLPSRLPAYRSVELSPYAHVARVGDDEDDDPCHFAPSLIDRIAAMPGQEVASRTFSNFFCGEEGQDTRDFEADLRAAVTVARRRGIILRSMAFPRRQIGQEYLDVCRRLGMTSYRGNPPGWVYGVEPDDEASKLSRRLRKAVRHLDSVLPITGTNCVADQNPSQRAPVNVAATRRYRPYAGENPWLAAMQRRRIFRELDYAVDKGAIFHLWCPMRDLGRWPGEQFDEMRRILDRFDGWRRLGRMDSVTMHEVVMGHGAEEAPRPPRDRSASPG